MRLAVVSDIHGNLPALHAVWEDLRHQGIDEVVCAGDLVNYGAFPDQVVEWVRQREVPCVVGNHDLAVGNDQDLADYTFAPGRDPQVERESFRWSRERTSLAGKAFLRSLPQSLTLERAGCTLLVFHGSPRAPREYLHADLGAAQLEQALDGATADFLLCGHTHRFQRRPTDHGVLVNAGSVGRPKDGDPRAGYACIDLHTGTVTERRVVYDLAAATTALLHRGLPAALAAALKAGQEITG